ncbi:MAG: M20/M25/M40 family metallo-hydrolase [Acidobacteriaceae bacterium]|nr:M20/M25/M40 family metallo-hydrolase [Acidobacteriaceae bacterium]
MIIDASSSWEDSLRERLQTHVKILATDIGGRLATSGLEKAAAYIEHQLRCSGYHALRQTFTADGYLFANIEAEISGVDRPEEILVIGAHYDTAGDLPGANDNASGVAATLELAREFIAAKPRRTIRWVFFANEEPPYFQTAAMGSYVHARRCRERKDNITGMVSLETIGYYTDELGSQTYPMAATSGYPDRGNFLGFVTDLKSAGLLHTALGAFRIATKLPAEGLATPRSIAGIDWSDHWSFWQFGYAALMVTDTAPFRYPHYHTAEDTPDKLHYPRFVEAVRGLRSVVEHLANE